MMSSQIVPLIPIPRRCPPTSSQEEIDFSCKPAPHSKFSTLFATTAGFTSPLEHSQNSSFTRCQPSKPCVSSTCAPQFIVNSGAFEYYPNVPLLSSPFFSSSPLEKFEISTLVWIVVRNDHSYRGNTSAAVVIGTSRRWQRWSVTWGLVELSESPHNDYGAEFTLARSRSSADGRAVAARSQMHPTSSVTRRHTLASSPMSAPSAVARALSRARRRSRYTWLRCTIWTQATKQLPPLSTAWTRRNWTSTSSWRFRGKWSELLHSKKQLLYIITYLVFVSSRSYETQLLFPELLLLKSFKKSFSM